MPNSFRCPMPALTLLAAYSAGKFSANTDANRLLLTTENKEPPCLRIAIFGSTRGTASKPTIDAIKQGCLNAKIPVIISNKPDAPILQRARDNNIPGVYISVKDANGNKKTEEAYYGQISNILHAEQIDLILLIGWMRILPDFFVEQWPNMLNVHPSLLPKFPGLMDLKVHEAVLAAGEDVSGCTVHYVTKVVDGGPIVEQPTCSVLPEDTPETLKARVQALEGEAFIRAIRKIAQDMEKQRYQAELALGLAAGVERIAMRNCPLVS